MIHVQIPCQGVVPVKELIASRIRQSIEVKSALLENPANMERIAAAATTCVECLQSGGKILFCGNGGSASDAQHLAAELSGRYYFDRKPLAAEALHVNTSYLTAVANDYSYDVVYARMIDGLGKSGDVLFGLSTSGNSKNVVNATEMARSRGMKVIAMTGSQESALSRTSDFCFQVPSTDTPRTQEAHILIGHIICELIEAKIFSKEKAEYDAQNTAIHS